MSYGSGLHIASEALLIGKTGDRRETVFSRLVFVRLLRVVNGTDAGFFLLISFQRIGDLRRCSVGEPGWGYSVSASS